MSHGRTALRSLLLLIPVAAAATIPAWAKDTWIPMGPHGTDVRALADDPTADRVFAGTRYGGIFVSVDGGESWSQASAGLPTDIATGSYESVNGVTVDPVSGRVYAMTAVNVFLSDNQGTTWSLFPRPSGAIGKFVTLYTDPDDHEKLTLLNQNGVFVWDFVGADTERSWSKPPGLDSTPVFGLERAPSDPDVFYAVASYQPKLYRSDNRAISWTLVGDLPGTAYRALAVDPQDPSRLYLSLDSGCFLSTNAGENWVRMDDPGDNAEVYGFLPLAGGLLAVGRGELLSNAALETQLAPVRGFYHTRGSDALKRADGTVLLATGMGVFEGTEDLLTGTGSLLYRSQGMNTTDIGVIAPAPGSPVLYVAAGQGFDAGVFRSDDDGLTWELRSMGLTNPDIRSLAVFPGNPDIVYAGSSDALNDTGENGTIYKTTDGGQSWTDVTAGLPHTGPRIIIALRVHPTNPDVVYASVQAPLGGIYKSTDGGVTWTRRSVGLESMPETPGHEEFHDYYAMLSLALDPENPERLFIGAGGCWGGTYRSTDGAMNWVRRAQGYMEYDQKAIDYGELWGDVPFWFPVHLELFDFDVDPNDTNHLFATGGRGDYLGAGQVGIVFESADGGESWSLVREGTRDDYFQSPASGLALHADRPDELFVSTRDGVRHSADGGETWEDFSTGLTGSQRFTRTIAFDPDSAGRIYVATAFGGLYWWPLGAVPTAVTLTRFDGYYSPYEKQVFLVWDVADAEGHIGFHVERERAGDRVRLTTTPVRGHFEDPSPGPERGAIDYYLIEVDRAGTETEYGPFTVQIRGTGPAYMIPPFPNPMQDSARIRIVATQEGGTTATVVVYDVSGRRVATLLEGQVGQGGTELVWDGTDTSGKRVSSGLYFIKATLGGKNQLQKLLVAR